MERYGIAILNAPLHRRERSAAVAEGIYLDNHALTPVDSRVAAAVHAEMMLFPGNANSTLHTHGERASRRLLSSAVAVADLFGAESDDVRFTSSATEALRLALAHAAGRRPHAPLRIAVSTIEHPALLEMVHHGQRAGAFAVKWIACDELARIPLEEIERVLDAGVDLLCVMAANNEVGTVQPLPEISDRVAKAGAKLLVDASQAAGRLPIDMTRLGLSYLVISGHKLYGPSGIGALVGPGLAEARFDWPVGGHEPTPNVPGAVGLAEACRLRQAEMAADEAVIGRLRDRLQAALLNAVPDITVNGDLGSRLAGNLHLSARGAPNDQVVAGLRGAVSISTGAACAAGADAPSHVLRAMRLSEWRQEGALRIGVGKFNTVEEIDVAAQAIAQAITEVRQRLGTTL